MKFKDIIPISVDDLDLETFGKKKKKKKPLSMKELDDALPDDKADVSPALKIARNSGC